MVVLILLILDCFGLLFFFCYLLKNKIKKQNQNQNLCAFQIFEKFVNMQSKEREIMSYMYLF